jgi:hypothetical protein
MDDKELTELQDFMKDISCLDELLPWAEKFNIFDVLKISRTEIRHSNMLGWMFNPNENHGFGDAFLKGILQCLVQRDKGNKYDTFKILLMDLYSFSVAREWRNIDILLTSPEEKTVSEKITSWGSYYWFKVNDRGERFRGYLELFGDNIPESSTDNMRKMIGKLKPKDNNDTSVGYKKLLSTKTYNLPELDAEDWDSSVRAMVRDAVMWLLNEEDKALKDC